MAAPHTRSALRRALWLAPVAFVVSVVAFALLASAPGLLPDHEPLPRFFNPNPVGVSQLAELAVQRIAAGRSDADKAAKELAGLGAAALPDVLPRLDALSPIARSRVALALRPLALRMGIAKQDDFSSGERAVIFWNQFWEDRAMDFRPVVVRRAVRRLARGGSASRRRELIELDTYALDELLRAIDAGPEDIGRTRRLTDIAAHITGNDWRIGQNSDPEQVQLVVAQWTRWWSGERARFTRYAGVERIGAMFQETRYGRWVQSVSSGRALTGPSIWASFSSKAPTSLFLFFGVLFSAAFVGPLWGALSMQLPERLRLLSSLLALALLAIPLAVWAPAFTHWSASSVSALFLLCVIAAALTSRFQRIAPSNQLGRRYLRSFRALGASRFQTTTLLLRESSSGSINYVGSLTPWLVTAIIVVETAFGINGLGAHTVSAFRAGDIDWLILMSVTIALVSGMVQIASDLVSQRLDRRSLGHMDL